MKKQSITLYSAESINLLLAPLLSYDWSKPLTVEIKEYRKTRSMNQNALYWKWMTEISTWLQKRGPAYAHWDSDFCHDAMKHTFLGYEDKQRIDITTGEQTTVSILKSTSRLDTGEMHRYMNQIYYYWAEKRLLLAIPESSEYADIMERHG